MIYMRALVYDDENTIIVETDVEGEIFKPTMDQLVDLMLEETEWLPIDSINRIEIKVTF